jgi:hypothetical protein
MKRKQQKTRRQTALHNPRVASSPYIAEQSLNTVEKRESGEIRSYGQDEM